MKKEKMMPALKWVLYSLLLLSCYVLQTTPGLFEIFGKKPVLAAALAVCVSMYEGVLSSAFFSMMAGLLWDISSNRLFGFNGLILLCCGVLISLLCIYYLHTRWLNSLLFCTLAMLVQGLLDYLFYYAIWGYPGVSLILVQNILPTLLYTAAVTPLLFLLVRRIHRKLSVVERA